MGKREEIKSRRQWGCLIPAALLVVLLFCIPLELYLSNNALSSEEITVLSDRLPAAFDGLRILQLSDLHEKTFGSDNEKLLSGASELTPDIIAITGDMIDSELGLTYAEKLLPKLTAIAPVYFVTGNHEWAADGKTAYLGRNRLINRLQTTVEESGAVWLDSSLIPLERGGESIILAGVSDPINRAAPGINALRQMADNEYGQELFTVLLSHRHDKDYTGFDVVLAGHAHGGVIRLPFTDGLIGPDREWFPKDTSGVLTRNGTQVVVSRGLGDTYAPRFLNRPQMLLVTLKRGEY